MSINEVRKARRLIISLAIAMMTVTFYVTGSSQTLPFVYSTAAADNSLDPTHKKKIVCKYVFFPFVATCVRDYAVKIIYLQLTILRFNYSLPSNAYFHDRHMYIFIRCRKNYFEEK